MADGLGGCLTPVEEAVEGFHSFHELPKSTAAPTWARDTMTKQALVAQANGDATTTLLASSTDFFLHPLDPHLPKLTTAGPGL